MKKSFFAVLFALVLASCGDTVSSLSLVEGDVALNLLISDQFNTTTQDLGTPVFSLNDNPDLLIFDVPKDLEPGYTLSKYIKIRNEGNVPISYSGMAVLTKPLEGQIFWFTMRDMSVVEPTSYVFNTKDQAFAEGHQFTLPAKTLLQRNAFHIFHLQLIINPGLTNEFNQTNTSYELAFNLSFTANYLDS